MTDAQHAHLQEEDDAPSKSQRKREMDALQVLGSALTELSNETLRSLSLPEDLLAALLEYRRLKAHGAQRRQRQYIGRIMRSVDPEPIRARLAIMRGESDQHNAWLHRLEHLRERLLADDSVLAEFITSHPHSDAQTLRTLLRNARKEQLENKAPKAYRQIFQQLKEIIPEPSLSHYKKDPEDET